MPMMSDLVLIPNQNVADSFAVLKQFSKTLATVRKNWGTKRPKGYFGPHFALNHHKWDRMCITVSGGLEIARRDERQRND